MRQRRYEFHRDENQILALVLDEASSSWMVEVSGFRLQRSSIPLTDFERSEDGQLLAPSLRIAKEMASRDAQ